MPASTHAVSPIAVEQPVHAFQIEEDASGGDRLALGRQPAAAARDGNAVALRDPEHAGDILRGAGMDHRVGKAVDDLAAVGPVAGARGAIGAEKHAAIVPAWGYNPGR